jgi:hypothetical protein
VTVRGSGFAAGDAVYLGILGPSQDGESETLTVVTAGQDGSFMAAVTIPQGGPLEPITLLAYPASFGPRSRETVSAAPKAIFTVIAAAQRPTAPTIQPPGRQVILPRAGTGTAADPTRPPRRVCSVAAGTDSPAGVEASEVRCEPGAVPQL